MCSPGSPKILYRNPRFLHLAFLQLHQQQQSGVFCDVLLQAEGEAVPAHCCILSACSPFFTERLEQETPAQGRKVVLELGGLKIGTLRKLVDFLYTSEMEVSWEEAQDLLSAARQLRVSELESLQLEGRKLVKAPQGRRLNRECLQPSAAPISARVVAPGCHLQTPLPGTQPPCPGAVRSLGLGREEGLPEQSAPPSLGSTPGTLMLLQEKARACRVPGPSSSSAGQGPEPKADKQGPASQPAALLPRKIRLSRPKPPPSGGPSGGPSLVPTAPGRRLWRQRANRGTADDRREPDRASPLRVPSPAAPSGKRGPEARVPPAEPMEEGQVGRVKLRKVVNGTCWEVVQEPAPALRTPDPRDGAAPPGVPLSPGSEQQGASARLALYQDSPESAGVLDIMLAAGHSPDQPGPGRPFGSSPELLGKEPMLSGSHSEDCAFVGASSSMAPRELEDILDLVLCGSDAGPPKRSPESPGPEGCRTPSYHLMGAGGAWMGEEWCLPDLELWSGELTGLEKEPAGENKELARAWMPGLDAATSQPPDAEADRQHVGSPGNPLTPGSSWAEGGLELCPAPGTGPDPPTASSEDEIDVVNWAAEATLVPASTHSVWPDPSSESETEVDVLT
ncbi:BTB/POZ domain-containing protein 18 [Fukomys damarensis]|nr:BTB/POZ domain-containing protein 18 [Fukomys damarensis]